jgi:hypothetical protein
METVNKVVESAESEVRHGALEGSTIVMTLERLQACYELAFYPPRLDEAWQRIKQGRSEKATPCSVKALGKERRRPP